MNNKFFLLIAILLVAATFVSMTTYASETYLIDWENVKEEESFTGEVIEDEELFFTDIFTSIVVETAEDDVVEFEDGNTFEFEAGAIFEYEDGMEESWNQNSYVTDYRHLYVDLNQAASYGVVTLHRTSKLRDESGNISLVKKGQSVVLLEPIYGKRTKVNYNGLVGTILTDRLVYNNPKYGEKFEGYVKILTDIIMKDFDGNNIYQLPKGVGVMPILICDDGTCLIKFNGRMGYVPTEAIVVA